MPTVDSAMSYSPATSSVMASIDEDDMTLEAKQCLQALKEGKRSVLQAPICPRSTVRCHTAFVNAPGRCHPHLKRRANTR